MSIRLDFPYLNGRAAAMSRHQDGWEHRIAKVLAWVLFASCVIAVSCLALYVSWFVIWSIMEGL